MKLSHKLVMVSAAALMGISPVVTAVQSTNTVMAADSKKTSKKTNTKTTKSSKNSKTTKKTSSSKSKAAQGDAIVLGNNSYVYLESGKTNKNYKYNGETMPVLGKTAKLNAFGTKTIDGDLYYSIGNGNYIKASDIATINGKKNKDFKSSKVEMPKTSKKTTKSKTTKTTKSKKSTSSKKTTKKKTTTKKSTKKAKTTETKLIHNAYVYDKNGKRIKSAGTLSKNSIIHYYSTKKIKGKNYLYLGNGQYVKSANAKKVDNTPEVEDTYIKLVKNSIVYDESGDAVDSGMKLSKGGQYQALAAKQISGKWYYQIGEGQWIKAVNAAVVQGPALIEDPDFDAPTIDGGTVSDSETVITLKRDTYTYNNKGVQSTSNKFAAGHKVRVTELTYIWIPSQNKALEFYRLASDPAGYILFEDVDTLTGKPLNVNNTAQDAKDAVTVATASDKAQLNAEIAKAASVQNDVKYTNASLDLKIAYDNALSSAKNTANSSTATVKDVKNALDNLTKAEAALNGVASTTTSSQPTTTTTDANTTTNNSSVVTNN